MFWGGGMWRRLLGVGPRDFERLGLTEGDCPAGECPEDTAPSAIGATAFGGLIVGGRDLAAVD